MIGRSSGAVLSASFALTLVVGFLSIDTASAQNRERDEALEEVVVTARAREESLQDIPLSITAYSADDIQEAGFRDLGDIALQTVGIEYDARNTFSTNGRINSNIRIRGAQVASSLANQQAASLFIDGVYALGGINSMPLNDLERVEVIKGPQSAFFGRNTFSGAVNYITRNPSLDEFETTIDVQAGQYEQHELSVLTSGPILKDKLGYQVNAKVYNKGNMWTTLDGGPLGEETTRSISGVLYAEPNDNLSIKLRYLYLKDEDSGPAEAYLRGSDYDTCTGRSYPGRYRTDGTPFTMDLSGRPAVPGPRDDGGPINYICGKPPKIGYPDAAISQETNVVPAVFTQTSGSSTGAPGSFQPQDPNLLRNYLLNRTFIPDVPYLDGFGMERFNRRAALTVNYDFENGSALNAVAGYNKQGLNFLRDYDHSDTPTWYSVDPQSAEDTSFEIRFNSPQDRRLRWLVGGTWYEQTFITNGGGGLLLVGCFDNFGSFVSSVGPSGNYGNCTGPLLPPNFARTAGRFNLPAVTGDEATVTGIFGSISFDITDKLTLDVEARFMDDERTVESSGFLLTENYKSENPRVILTFKPDEDTTLYGQFSQGSLPGRVNGLVTICSPDDFLVSYISPITGQPSTDSECKQLAAQGAIPSTPVQELSAYEIGLKKGLLDGRLNLTAAAYYWEWDGKPAGVSVQYVRDAENIADRDGIPNAFPNSLGASVSASSEMYGVELETAYLINDNWNVNFNVSYTKTEFTEFFVGGLERLIGTTNFKGLEEPRVPEVSWNLSTTYADQLSGEWDWFARADFIYSGDYYADYANLAEGPAFLITNLRFGVEKDDLRLELWVRNALDEDEWRSVNNLVDFTPLPADFEFTAFQGLILAPQDKRSIGIRASIDF